MVKKISLSIFVIFIVMFSIGAIHADDVNAADLNAVGSVDDAPINLEDSIILNDINDDSSAENAKNQTQILPQKTDIYYNGPYEIVLSELSSNATIPDKNVNVVINNVKYANTTNDKGIALINLNLNPGTYTVTAAFEGDDTYDSSNMTSQITVLPSIKASNITKYYKGSQKYTATFFDTQGNVLKSKEVTIAVNGKSYTKKTDSKGIASLSLGFKPGNYQITARNPVTGYTLTTGLKVLSTVSASDLKKVKGDSRKFTAKFLKSNGKALTYQKVKIKINSKTYKYKTNSKGKVKLSFNSFKKGTYKVICYNKDGLSKTNTVKVYNKANTKLTVNVANDYTILPNGNKNVKIKFSTSLGGDSNAGKAIKIKINDQTYYRNTDKNGLIDFNLPVTEGIFTIEYSHAGDKFFRQSVVTTHVTVLKTNDTQLEVKGLKSFGYGAGSLFKVIFKAGSVPLAKKTVTFAIGTETFLTTTDNSGIASIPINLNVGNYTVNYAAHADSMVKAASGSCDIDVFVRSPSKLTWKCGNVYNDDLQSFAVLLTNSNGTPISGGKVQLTIDGRTYTAKSASDGYAVLKTSVPLGKYKISVKYIGGNDYLPVSISKNINVKTSKFGAGLNVKDEGYYSSAYLRSSSHCQVNDPKIKSLVKSLTSGLTDDIDKVKAIFNYVRDNIVYDYYYDTKHGAVGTLNAKSGNCVDQAHLLISMYRTAGFKARYVHGNCFFSVHWYGHVWTQVLVGNTWIVGDPIDYVNSLGKIKNWNPNTYKLHSRYVSLPF